MKIIGVSDIHLGYEKSESEAFRAFLNDLPTLNPDYFIILGDFVELWRRDMAAALLECSDILAKLKELNKQMEVVLIAGNHDWHFMRMGRNSEMYPPPFRFKESFSIHMTDFFYSFKHGHQYDPVCKYQRPNNSLCYTPEDISRLGFISLATWFWGRGRKIQISVPELSRIRIREPGYMRKMPALIDVIRSRAKADRLANEFLVHGHSHQSFLDKDGMYADTGCWVDGHTDYLLIEDEAVSLMSY